MKEKRKKTVWQTTGKIDQATNADTNGILSCMPEMITTTNADTVATRYY